MYHVFLKDHVTGEMDALHHRNKLYFKIYSNTNGYFKLLEWYWLYLTYFAQFNIVSSYAVNALAI